MGEKTTSAPRRRPGAADGPGPGAGGSEVTGPVAAGGTVVARRRRGAGAGDAVHLVGRETATDSDRGAGLAGTQAQGLGGTAAPGPGAQGPGDAVLRGRSTGAGGADGRAGRVAGSGRFPERPAAAGTG